jgi:protocatechuate 3,4-dioxygenase beta subunit
MKTPLDNDLNEAYEAFNQDHDRLRQTLLASLPNRSKAHKQMSKIAYIRALFGDTIMKNRITKLTTAAVIAVAVIVGIKGFNGTTAWAKVLKALNSAENIHIITKVTRPNGRIETEYAWLKNRAMFRQDETDEITIDDGQSRLYLDLENKTAQLSESESPFKDYMETGHFEIILLFSGRETPFKATELPDERSDTERVFEIAYRDVWAGKAWVDTTSNLPKRIMAAPAEEYKQHALSLEVIYDYEPIPMDKFHLTIPAGYTELPRPKTRLFSGKVIDEQGKPVAGAEVVTSNEDIKGKTNEQGEFAIPLHPRFSSLRLPMIVRALKADDPGHVAWTLLRNPRHELRPLFRPDDGKTKLEQGGGVDIHLVDEKKLLEFIPGEPPKMIFNNEADRYPSEVRDIVLQMGPASVITGRVTDRDSKPIANAVIKLQYMNIVVGENEINMSNLGITNKEIDMLSSFDGDELGTKTFAMTDKNGNYKLGNLPDVWSEVRLEAQAAGYVTEAKRFFQQEDCNFSLLRGDMTIRGSVIDNYGQPLVGREVEIDVDSDEVGDFDIEEVFTDSDGIFELAGVPAIDGLELQIRTDEKPRDWDENELTRDRKFIYYLMIEKSIKFEPGKKEYTVEIVPHRPDITLEIEVKDSKGNLLEGVPIGISSHGFSERIWYLTKLTGKTNEKGLCTINEVPYIEPLNLWISDPPARQMYYWEDGAEGAELNPQIKNAIIESLSRYHPIIIPVKLEKEKKKYRIPVTLQAIDE